VAPLPFSLPFPFVEFLIEGVAIFVIVCCFCPEDLCRHLARLVYEKFMPNALPKKINKVKGVGQFDFQTEYTKLALDSFKSASADEFFAGTFAANFE